MSQEERERLSRRLLLRDAGLVAGAALIGCSEPAASFPGPDRDSGYMDSGDFDGGSDVGATDAGTDVPMDSAMDSAAELDAGTELASGGTAGFDGTYPDPFIDMPSPACELTCEQTLGPCYADVQLNRRDITDGRIGWPMRVAFQLLESDACTPLSGADVEIWQTDSEGNYSGVARDICHPFEVGAPALTFMRGTQTSDAQGRVDFDAVFPGWYPGRTPHIHFTIRIPEGELLTSQVYFRDELAAFAYREHVDYDHRPVQATNNGGDRIAQNAGIERFTMGDRIVEGRALQCWFTCIVRSSADGMSC
ncbi:MAG: protocatechuate 3,4-dioxygenase beta subunit [Polyangiales bacterium]|jgi:protocatechuate 3,4-dioxygenase beta subunit